MIVIAEGLAELLPEKYLDGIGRDEHGHISIAAVNLHDIFQRADRRGIPRANRQETQSHAAAARLRSRAVPSPTPST